MGLTDLERMRSARPRGICGGWRFLLPSRAAARSSRGVDIGEEQEGKRIRWCLGLEVIHTNVKTNLPAHLLEQVLMPAPGSSCLGR